MPPSAAGRRSRSNSDALLRQTGGVLSADITKKPDNRADSDQELVDLVAKVLQSPHVLSAAQSLIARASAALAAK
ncbi:MAG TPA: hypothetical protein VJ783_19330 [Pirellulales bacterium]|nr:hypothetical protein [Pirellulales bacterium]